MRIFSVISQEYFRLIKDEVVSFFSGGTYVQQNEGRDWKKRVKMGCFKRDVSSFCWATCTRVAWGGAAVWHFFLLLLSFSATSPSHSLSFLSSSSFSLLVLLVPRAQPHLQQRKKKFVSSIIIIAEPHHRHPTSLPFSSSLLFARHQPSSLHRALQAEENKAPPRATVTPDRERRWGMSENP